MKSLKFLSAIIAIFLLTSTAAFAQSQISEKKLQIQFTEFESSNLYGVGHYEQNQFGAELDRGIRAGESRIVDRKTIAAAPGERSIVGSDNNLIISDRNRQSYDTGYRTNQLIVLPNLLGGETDETSNLVNAKIFYQRAAALPAGTRQGSPMIDLTAFNSSITGNLDSVMVIAGGAKNARGTFTYLAVKFSRL